jgi:dTDP-4-amino-4,6-dideoxygalactose transaminase
VADTAHHAAGLMLAHLELRRPAVAGLGRSLRALGRRVWHVDAATGTDHLRARDLWLGAADVVEQLVARLDLDMVITRRRRNYRRLVAALGDVATLVRPELPDGVCPLSLPVRVADKAAAMRALGAAGVAAIDLWSSGDPACPLDRFGDVAALRREVLELPCHQSLDDEAIDRVAAAARVALVPGRPRG